MLAGNMSLVDFACLKSLVSVFSESFVLRKPLPSSLLHEISRAIILTKPPLEVKGSMMMHFGIEYSDPY